MRAMLLTVVCSVNLLAAGREMNVAICNLGAVSESVVSQAKSETDLVYRSAGVQITWHSCEEFPTLDKRHFRVEEKWLICVASSIATARSSIFLKSRRISPSQVGLCRPNPRGSWTQPEV
jgi:hypothetical protein